MNYLLEALRLAYQGKGSCAPNPAVGAVVVKDGQIIASGFHQQAGMAHAEVNALQQLSPQDCHGATLYVTLQPCCHHGRTPPCTDLIISKQVAKVVYAYSDPNPEVALQQNKALLGAGIIVEQLVVPEINHFYRSYQHYTHTQTPWVTAKLAISKDAKIAGEHGRKVAITESELNHKTHRHRKYSDAILTTVATVQNDDPQLNVRLQGKVLPKAIYVIDPYLAMPRNAQLFTTAKQLTFLHSEEVSQQAIAALTSQGGICKSVASRGDLLDLPEVMKLIAIDGIHDLWLEAGSRFFTAMHKANLVHETLLYHGERVVGEQGLSAGEFCQDLLASRRLSWHNAGIDRYATILWNHNNK